RNSGWCQPACQSPGGGSHVRVHRLDEHGSTIEAAEHRDGSDRGFAGARRSGRRLLPQGDNTRGRLFRAAWWSRQLWTARLEFIREWRNQDIRQRARRNDQTTAGNHPGSDFAVGRAALNRHLARTDKPVAWLNQISRIVRNLAVLIMLLNSRPTGP